MDCQTNGSDGQTGILTGKDIFSSKWITAQITDAYNRRYFVPIKHTIGDYFLADIEGDIYCFKVDPSRISVYQHTLVRSFRMLDYNLSHYLPISAADNRELETVLKENNLPKVNMMLFNIFKILGKREKESFTPHDLMALVEDVAEHQDDEEYRRQIQNIKNYLTHLDVNSIVRPVRKISEFIEGDLIQADPHFFGTIVTQVAKVEQEHRKITNSPEKGKKSWILVGFIIAIICVIALAGYLIWDSGMLTNALPKFGQPSPEQLMNQYPTPEALKAAIDRGDISYNELPKEVQDMVDAYEPPQVTTP